ncbi:dTDP-glucose 4,6-dehydratase [Virgibacillus kimchii]
MKKQHPTLLITGGAGFIGSNFIHYILHHYPEYQIINMDKLTYAGSKSNLLEAEGNDNYLFIQGDIKNSTLVNAIFNEYDISGVVHFAAESHVDRSIEDAAVFTETNLVGTMTLLQAAKNAWEKDGVLKERRFHHISTDEVYGSLGGSGKFTEKTPYDPRNPYSASKAGSDMLVKSFGHTYGMDVIITSCSNNYGPRQHEEKLIPTIISHALKGKPIPIYGDGQNVRDWLYVADHCQALDVIFHQSDPMETYNIGGNNEKTNIEIANTICNILDEKQESIRREKGLTSFSELISFTEDRLGHDRRYAIDATKLRNHLGWTPQESLTAGLQKTVDWYVSKWLPQLTR